PLRHLRRLRRAARTLPPRPVPVMLAAPTGSVPRRTAPAWTVDRDGARRARAVESGAPARRRRSRRFGPIRAGLADVKLPDIVAACSVSKTAASGWLAGRHVPPLRHWHALAKLAGVPAVDPETGELIGALA
ncbi:MAG: hypothetical protein ACRD6W_08160, partial [Nitrososphaerales archaeon]